MWYFQGEDQRPNGPYDLNAIQSHIHNGAIQRQTLVWRTGTAEWRKAEDIPEFVSTWSATDAPPPPLPSHSPPNQNPPPQHRPQHEATPTNASTAWGNFWVQHDRGGLPEHNPSSREQSSRVAATELTAEPSFPAASKDRHAKKPSAQQPSVEHLEQSPTLSAKIKYAHRLANWPVSPPAPWRRFAARIFDTTFSGFIGFFLFAIAFYAIAPATADAFFVFIESGAGRIFDILATATLASVIGGPLIGVTGFTLGKIIFGTKLVSMDGEKIGIKRGWLRDFSFFCKRARPCNSFIVVAYDVYRLPRSR